VVTARAILLAVAAVAGCTVSHEVLRGDDAPVTTCDQVWASGAPGDPCTLTAPCERDSPDDPSCCFDYAYCRMGELVMDTTCNPDCSSCVDDHSCVAGAATCDGMTCTPCPPIGPGQLCPPCPANWINLTRNGCPTCECAPPNECAPGPDGTSGCNMDPNGDQCYQGERFADPGCAPDDAGCFANVCSMPGCTSPAPLGCFTACDPTTMPPCQMCATTACECDPATGAWTCQSICIDGFSLSLNCFL
jgi:hypothetical protein